MVVSEVRLTGAIPSQEFLDWGLDVNVVSVFQCLLFPEACLFPNYAGQSTTFFSRKLLNLVKTGQTVMRK